jgi:glycine cleavage system H protein
MVEEIIVADKYRVPKDRYYTKEHEWVFVEDGERARIGITDYAQSELGDIVFVELPELGQEVEQNDTLANIESVKSVAPVYAPVSGKVVDINTELEESPELINEYPYEDGWIAVIEMRDPTEVEDLMSAEEYAEYIKELVEEEGDEGDQLFEEEELPEPQE